MSAMGGDCKYPSSVSSAELLVFAARSAGGPFEPVAIERRGKLFAWRPSAPGLWYLRVDRRSAGLPAERGGAIVVAYEPEAGVNAQLTILVDGRMREGIALLPAVEPDEQRPDDRDCCDWLMPYLFLRRPTASGAIAMRLPRGRYVARESHIERGYDRDGKSGRIWRVRLWPLIDGQSGTVDVAGDGDVHLTLHAIERLPRPRAE
jgi:hypothetical protein